MRALLLLALISGCVTEADVDLYVVLPDTVRRPAPHADAETACDFAGADQLIVDIAGPLEQFTVRSDHCRYDSEVGAAGFLGTPDEPLRIERLIDDYYHLTATIVSADGATIGRRVQPFEGGEGQLVIYFAREDLPGWRTEEVTLHLEACAAATGAEVSLTALPFGAVAPQLATTVACDGSDTAITAELARGPVTVTTLVPGCPPRSDEIVVTEEYTDFTLDHQECAP